MTAFVDSSAVVKRYVPERQSEVVRQLTGLLVVSAVSPVEVASALWRKHRLGEVEASDAATLVAAFEAELAAGERYAVVSLGPELLTAAVAAVARHGLRAYDAVQLATALVARQAVGAALGTFAAFDTQLRTAAAAEGFTLVPDRLDR